MFSAHEATTVMQFNQTIVRCAMNTLRNVLAH